MFKEHIAHAAISRSDGVISVGKQHADIIQSSPFGTCKNGSVQGFTTNTDRFVCREKAAKIAFEAGQIKNCKEGKKLMSEEVWIDNNYKYDEEKGYYKDE